MPLFIDLFRFKVIFHFYGKTTLWRIKKVGNKEMAEFKQLQYSWIRTTMLLTFCLIVRKYSSFFPLLRFTLVLLVPFVPIILLGISALFLMSQIGICDHFKWNQWLHLISTVSFYFVLLNIWKLLMTWFDDPVEFLSISHSKYSMSFKNNNTKKSVSVAWVSQHLKRDWKFVVVSSLNTSEFSFAHKKNTCI